MNDDRLTSSTESAPDIGGHPRGTLAIVGIYGLVFVIGWLIIYFFVFVPRGTITP